MDMITVIFIGGFGIACVITGYRWGRADREIDADNLPKRGANGRFQKRGA